MNGIAVIVVKTNGFSFIIRIYSENATRTDPEPLSSSSAAQDANPNPSAATAANTANVFKNFFIK